MRWFIVLILLIVSKRVDASIELKNIDSICVYLYFPERGYTTAALFAEVKNVSKANYSLYTLNDKEEAVFIEVFANANVKKHKQTKLGRPVFGEIRLNNEKHIVAFFTNGLIDLTTRENFKIIGEENRLAYIQLLDQIRSIKKID